MATVEKRGTGWSVRYRERDAYGNLGKQVRKSGFATKADAMAAVKYLEEASTAGIDINGDRMTCGEIMERWFLTKPGQIEDTTLSKYSYYMDKLKDHVIYNTPVRQLSRGNLTDVINDLQSDSISLRTARDYTEPLRMALSWAAGEGLIARNPLAGARLPKIQKRQQVILSDDDVEDLVAECKNRNPAFLIPLYLALYGGLCREEAAALTWDKVDFAHASIRIQSALAMTHAGIVVQKDTKTVNRSRTVTLPKFVMTTLESTQHTSDRVCVSRTGEPYSLTSYAQAVRRLAEFVNRRRDEEGKELMPVPGYHDLRHTHAAMCIALGIQPKVISERLGHSSIKITMDLYGYLMPGLQAQVAEAFDQKRAQ